MYKIVTITFLFIFISIAPLFATECDNSIKVTGRAELKAKPDIAYVTLYAKADGILMVDAVRNTNELVEKITDAIKQQDSIIKKIVINDISLGQTKVEYWRSSQQQETPRPQVIKKIRIHCKPNSQEIYHLIDKAIRAGAVMQVPSTAHYANGVQSIVAYGLENYEEIILHAKEMAITDARAKAEKVAKLAKISLGNIVGIGCSSTSSFRDSMRFMGNLEYFPTEYIGVNEKEIIVSSKISVSYEINKINTEQGN